MTKRYFFLVLILCETEGILAYSTGAPEEACSTMTPKHEGGGLRNSVPPYQLTINETSKALSSGTILNVTFQSAGNRDFRGFLIMARIVSSTTIVGRFKMNDSSSQILNCGNGDALSHVDGDLKQSVSAMWIVPTFHGQQDVMVEFVFTVVFSKNEYWTKSSSGNPFAVSPYGSKDVTSTTTLPSFEDKYDPTKLYSQCGRIFGCFGTPAGCAETKSCSILVQYRRKLNTFKIVVMGQSISDENYIAMAWSTDALMGDDLVFSCHKHKKNFSYGVGWNAEKENIIIDGFNLTNVFFREEDGKFMCSFNLIDEFYVTPSAAEGKVKFDLTNRRYHILLATGKLENDGVTLQKHSIRGRSSDPVDIESTKIAEQGSSSYVRYHGFLMTLAWLGCASTGTLIARYYKYTWTELKIKGKDLWFVVHQVLMLLTIGLTTLGFILIVRVVGLLPYDFDFIRENPHPILGMTCLILSYIQAVTPVLIPRKNSRSRFIFKIVHWIVGNLAFNIALSVIFLSVDLAGSKLPDYVNYVLAFFIIVHVIVHIGLSIQAYLIDDDTNKVADSNGNLRQGNSFDHAGSDCRKVILVIYIALSWITTLFMVAVIGKAPGKGNENKINDENDEGDDEYYEES